MSPLSRPTCLLSARIYCFRGGLRSQIAQQWLVDAGLHRPRIEGGWKALRQQLCQRIDEAAQQPMLVVAGLTGCAKTKLINQLPNGIDLEACANHKGSAFGRQPDEPTTQIDFEHALGQRLIGQPGKLVLEDESRQIGNANLPLVFGTLAAPRIREMPLNWRLNQLRRDYIEALNRVTPLAGREEWQRMQRQLAGALSGWQNAWAMPGYSGYSMCRPWLSVPCRRGYQAHERGLPAADRILGRSTIPLEKRQETGPQNFMYEIGAVSPLPNGGA